MPNAKTQESECPLKSASQTTSLIITVLNEQQSIDRFLDSLSAQSRIPDEFIVVDGGSTDRTVEILRDWSSRAPMPTKIVDSPGAGISAGRNQAIALASGSLIAVTDAGTRLHPDWLLELHNAYVKGDCNIVAGFFVPEGNRFVERTIAFAITPTLDEIDGETFLPSSRSVLFERRVWESVGGYPEWLDYCEDIVFDLAIKAREGRFGFAPDAVVTWSARATLRAYFKQYFRYARGDGKAGLWPRRHALRYSAYAIGGVVSVAAPRRASVLLMVGYMFYARKFSRRVLVRRGQIGRSWPAALAMVPVVITVGDVAKMLGYPVGLLWRVRRQGGRA
jgi:glycosyltransferase involved in cell wall biosynthesis